MSEKPSLLAGLLGVNLREAKSRSIFGGLLAAVFPVDRVLKPATQALRPLDALGLERSAQPLVTLSNVPDCTVCHIGRE